MDRYDLGRCEGDSGRCCADLTPSEDGEWVSYEDVAAIEEENERLRLRGAEMLKCLQELRRRRGK